MNLFGARKAALRTSIKEIEELLKESLSPLQAQLKSLQAAFDAWFDVVAGELGYEAEKEWCADRPFNFPLEAESPRRYAKTVTPAISTPVRTEPKICARRKRRKSNATG